VGKSSPAKASVECPHCGFKQLDYAAAKTTMCRQCGKTFSPALPARVETKSHPRHEAGATLAETASSFLGKFEGLWQKPRNFAIECFECKARHEVTSAAESTTCPKCSAHQDLRDYKIATSFSRSIRTHGEVHILSKGDLSSTNVVCRAALIEGKLRGNMHCAETARVTVIGKIPGRLAARQVVIERKSEVQFFRQLRAQSVEIHGRMTGDVVAESGVVIHRNAALEGNVTAKSISVEKGGLFLGQLVIGSIALKQAELLPKGASELVDVTAENTTPLLVPQPLPAA
jgi:cytoskeletal protein CcmA (bactofilin family)/DNA-directed RNA polymerase subunit RPC12/RpoP